MCARRHEEGVEEIIVTVERLIAGGELDGNGVFAGTGGIRGNNQVIFGINRRNLRLAHPDATDSVPWCRKINDDAVRSGHRRVQDETAQDGLLPASGHRKRQIVANRCENGRPFARKGLRDTAVDRISGRNSNERHQKQAEHRGPILSKIEPPDDFATP